MTKNSRGAALKIITVMLLVMGILAGWLFLHIKRMNEKGIGNGLVPKIRLSRYIVSSYSEIQTKMEIQFVLENPWPIGVTIDSLQYLGSISGKEVLRDTYAKKSRINASDTSLIYFPLILKNQEMMSVLKTEKIKESDSVIYRIDFKIFAQVPLFRGNPIRYTWEEKLPLYKVPDMKIENIRLKQAGLKNAELVVDVRFINPNVFQYKFKDSQFELRLDEELIGTGYSDEKVIVPANGSGTMKSIIHLKTIKAVSKGVRAMVNKKNTSYFYRFSCVVLGETPEENSKVDFIIRDDHIPSN